MFHGVYFPATIQRLLDETADAYGADHQEPLIEFTKAIQEAWAAVGERWPRSSPKNSTYTSIKDTFGKLCDQIRFKHHLNSVGLPRGYDEHYECPAEVLVKEIFHTQRAIWMAH
jgi:hypothetical protein